MIGEPPAVVQPLLKPVTGCLGCAAATGAGSGVEAMAAGGAVRAAVATLDRAIGIAPFETGLLQALGSVYAASKRLPEAIGTFRSAIERDPESAAAFNNLGSALLRSGAIGGAEAAMREAIRRSALGKAKSPAIASWTAPR